MAVSAVISTPATTVTTVAVSRTEQQVIPQPLPPLAPPQPFRSAPPSPLPHAAPQPVKENSGVTYGAIQAANASTIRGAIIDQTA